MITPAWIDCRAWLPPDYAERVRRVAVLYGRRVKTSGRGPGSLEPDETAGLDYIVVPGDVIRDQARWLWNIYHDPGLAHAVGEALGARVEPSPDASSCININYLAGAGGRYERHVDGQPYTLNLFVTEHDGRTGGLLDLDGTLIYPRPGFGIPFDGAAIPHAVTPLLGGERLTIPMVFLAEDAAARPAGLSDYLYTEQP